MKIPNILNTIQNMSGGQRQCVAIARTATFHSKLTIMDEPTAALGVQETAQVENIIRTLKEQGEPLILISHNMRQVIDLCDRIVVWRRGRICANLNKEETDGQDVVAYITGAKTQADTPPPHDPAVQPRYAAPSRQVLEVRSESMTIRIGVIGTGAIGRDHARRINQVLAGAGSSRCRTSTRRARRR